MRSVAVALLSVAGLLSACDRAEVRANTNASMSASARAEMAADSIDDARSVVQQILEREGWQAAPQTDNPWRFEPTDLVKCTVPHVPVDATVVETDTSSYLVELSYINEGTTDPSWKNDVDDLAHLLVMILNERTTTTDNAGSVDATKEPK